jgi:hypothetical protein
MKNVVTVFMVRNGDNPSSLSEQDYLILANMIAVIHSYFKWFKNKYSRNPQKLFFDQLRNMSKNKEYGLHILFDILGESKPEKLFKPKDFGIRIKDYQQNLPFDNDNLVITELQDEMNSHRYVRRQDIERALRSLEKEFDIENVQGKKEIKKLKGIREKMKFLGKPSVDRLGTEAIQIKRVLQNGMALQFVSKAPKNLGIVESLSLLFEGSLIFVSNDKKGRSYELVKIMDFHFGNSEQRVNRPDWERYKKEVVGSNIQNIISVSKQMAEVLVECPLFIPILLSIAFRKRLDDSSSVTS